MFKNKSYALLQVHVTSRFGLCEEDSSSTSTDDKYKILAKKPRLFGFIAASLKEKFNNSVGKWKDTLKKKSSILMTIP